MTSFDELGLRTELLRAVRAEGYSSPTPIQAKAIPHVLGGGDVLGCAQTGTGKTAAFSLPLLERLANAPERLKVLRVLVLVPTRELALQVGASFRTYGGHLPMRVAVVHGGVGQGNQVASIDAGADIVVATPGRLLDLHAQRLIDLSRVEALVLDEADRMLDMGFIDPIRKILALLPKRRQNLLFSATMPDAIRSLADSLLHAPIFVGVAPTSSTAPNITQLVYPVELPSKVALLAHLLRDPTVERAIVFTRTKHGADKVAKKLAREEIAAAVIHGNKSQGARVHALTRFRSGESPVLIATDVASRGIDVEGITHVFNFDIPNEPEVYVHRIGRTARAGATGVAIAFCSASERGFLRAIERLTAKPLKVIAEHPFAGATPEPPATPEPRKSSPAGGRSGAAAGDRPPRRDGRPAAPGQAPGPPTGTRRRRRPRRGPSRPS